MKRLVYAPKINAYIKADSGVYDLTEYITDFSIDRKINQVSTAEITFRNPNKKWTNHEYTDTITGQKKVGPIFHPMDPITILLTRLQNRPVQVFTGYCDTTPYLQLFPGTVQIKASCTLKKLQYTYFDAGLPFMREYLEEKGWDITADGSQIFGNNKEEAVGHKASEVNEGVVFGDSGIGELLADILRDVGGWDNSTIYIQKMPPSVINLIANLFDLFKKEGEEANEELTKLLKKIISTAASGAGAPTAGGSTPTSEATSETLKKVNITNSTPGPPWWDGAYPIFSRFVTPYMEDHGLSAGSAKRTPAENSAVGGSPTSDHLSTRTDCYATDYPTNDGASIANELAKAMGASVWHENSYDKFSITVSGLHFEVQILWGAAIEHGDHIHVGITRV